MKKRIRVRGFGAAPRISLMVIVAPAQLSFTKKLPFAPSRQLERGYSSVRHSRSQLTTVLAMSMHFPDAEQRKQVTTSAVPLALRLSLC